MSLRVSTWHWVHTRELCRSGMLQLRRGFAVSLATWPELVSRANSCFKCRILSLESVQYDVCEFVPKNKKINLGIGSHLRSSYFHSQVPCLGMETCSVPVAGTTVSCSGTTASLSPPPGDYWATHRKSVGSNGPLTISY